MFRVLEEDLSGPDMRCLSLAWGEKPEKQWRKQDGRPPPAQVKSELWMHGGPSLRDIISSNYKDVLQKRVSDE